MRDTEKILRNWKIIWTALAILLSIIIFVGGARIVFSEVFNAEVTVECRGCQYISCYDTVTFEFNDDWFMVVFGGGFSFLLIQLLHFAVWACRNKLVK